MQRWRSARARAGGRRWLLVALVVHTAIAVALLSAAWSNPLHSLVGPPTYGTGLPNADHIQSVWFVRWTAFAVANHHNPLLTTYLNAPAGANLAWNTSMPLPGLLVSPITLTFGPILAITVICTAAFVVCGMAATACALRFTTHRGIALLAGVLYEASPYAVTQMQGHPHLVLGAALAPFALLLVVDVARGARSARFGAILLGAAAAATYYTSSEMLLSTAVLGLIGLIAACLTPWRAARATANPLAISSAGGAALAAVLMLPGLLVQFLGPQRLSGSIHPAGVVVTDLQNLIVPTHVQAFAPQAALAASTHWTGNSFEWSGYLGIPLILAVLATVVALRRVPAVRWLAVVLAVALLISLGPALHVGGTVTSIPLPWALLDHAPLLRNIVVGRFAAFAMLAALLLFVIGIERALQRRRRAIAAAAAALVVLSLVPTGVAATTPTIPAYFTSAAVRALPQGTTALVAPYATPLSPSAMLWQVQSGMRFRMPAGYLLIPGPGGRVLEAPSPSAAATLLIDIENGIAPPLGGRLHAAVLADLHAWHVTTVIVGPMAHEAVAVSALASILGHPPRLTGGVAVWTGLHT